MAEANGIVYAASTSSPQAVEAFFNAPRPQDNLKDGRQGRARRAVHRVRIRAARDGDLTKATAEERGGELRDQLSQVAGGDAQQAYVKSARAKYQIKVAEDRL